MTQKRIALWDQLRGLAILAMIITHFGYFNARAYDGISLAAFVRQISGLGFLLAAVINLHMSFLAPFLFLAVIGVVCHIKFSSPTYRFDLARTGRSTLRLLAGALVFNVMSLLFQADWQAGGLPALLGQLLYPNLLVTITLVYLFNELVLQRGLRYFNWRPAGKVAAILALAALIWLFNRTTRTVYLRYLQLPYYMTVFLTMYTSLLGDLWADLVTRRGLRYGWPAAAAGGLLAAAAIVTLRPTTEAIKMMNLAFYGYCFMLLLPITWALLRLGALPAAWAQRGLGFVQLLGRHSLALYVWHFFLGWVLELLLLRPFVPEGWSGAVILPILLGCAWLARYLETPFSRRLAAAWSLVRAGSRLESRR